MKRTFLKSVSLAAALIILASVFCMNAFAVSQSSLGGRFGTVSTVKSDYKTKCSAYTVNGDSGKIYLYFKASDSVSDKARANIFYDFALYSDEARKVPVVTANGSFPAKNSTAAVPWNVSALASGKYYGRVNTRIKNSAGNMVVDSDSVNDFTVSVNKVGAQTPVLSSVSVTAAGNYFEWSAVKYADKYRIYRKAPGDTSWVKLADVTETSYTDKSVTAGEKYTYTVKAFDGESASLYNKTGVYAVYLTAPVMNKPVSAENNGIALSWNAVKGAGGYILYKKAAGGSYERLAKLGNVTEYTDYCGEISGEELFNYKVRAINGITAGLVSAPVKAAVFGKVKISDISCAYGEVNIKWDETEGADTYYLYKKTAGGEWSLLLETAEVFDYKDIEIENGETYYYSLQVKKNGKLSSFDAEGCRVTNLGSTKITGVGNSVDGSVLISWKAVDGAAGYRVYRENNNGDFEYLGKTSKLKFNDTKEKTNNLKYVYTVEAFSDNSLGESEYVTGSVIFMAPPEITSVKAVSNGNQIKWNRVAGATAYKVYRKTPSGSWEALAMLEGALSYVDANAKKGAAYYYTVAAMNGKITGSYNRGKGINCLDAPVLTGAEIQSSGNVKISWNAVSGAKGYYVYVKTDASSWKRLGSTTALTFTDKSAKTSGEEYIYTVKAYDGKQSAAYDSLGKTVLFLSVPKLALENENGVNTVSWKAVGGAESYTVYRRPVGGSFSAIGKNLTACSFKDSAHEGEYEYAVRAVSGSVRSGYMTVK